MSQSTMPSPGMNIFQPQFTRINRDLERLRLLLTLRNRVVSLATGRNDEPDAVYRDVAIAAYKLMLNSGYRADEVVARWHAVLAGKAVL